MRVLSRLPRHLALALACVVTLTASASSAAAAIAYRFEFFNYVGQTLFDPFTVTVVMPDYIDVTGMNPLSSSLPTTLDYDIVEFGGNIRRDFMFSAGGGFLGDNSAGYSAQSFTFDANTSAPNYAVAYIDTPGVYQGFVSGNAFGRGIFGRATLTVSEVPEPTTWALMILGFGAAGAALRQRRMARA